MPVYAFGLPADMDKIIETAEAFGLPVIADAAAAIGATYKDRPVGDIGATLTVHSFNGNKTITAGGGGAISSRDIKLLDTVRHLSTTARIGPDYTHDRVGFNYRMTNLQAAVGCAQMERFKTLVETKQNIRKTYDGGLKAHPNLAPFPEPAWAESACWISGAVADTNATAEAARARLVDVGFMAQAFWKPMHLQPPYTDCPTTSCPSADDLWYRVLPLPNSTSLSPVDQERIIDALSGLIA